jgi:hypothetical protein
VLRIFIYLLLKSLMAACFVLGGQLRKLSLYRMGIGWMTVRFIISSSSLLWNVKPLAPITFAFVSTYYRHQSKLRQPEGYYNIWFVLLMYSTKKACISAVGILISWWWLNFLHLFYMAYTFLFEELDGPAVSALSVRSQKLSNVLNGQLWDAWPKFIISSSVFRKAR